MKALNINISIQYSLLGILFLTFFACKKDVANEQTTIIYPDFLINGIDIEQFGVDYPGDELEKYKNDNTKIYVIKVGESASFKDISKKDENAGSRSWQLDEEDWDEVRNKDKSFGDQINFTFNEARYHRIGLVYGKRSLAIKLIRVVDDLDVVAVNIDDPKAEKSVQVKSVQAKPVQAKPTKRTKPKLQGNIVQQFPDKMNFEFMFKNLFSSNNSSANKETIFRTYKDSLAHFIVDKSLIDVDGIADDLSDVISMAIITGKRLSLKGEPIYKDGKIAYMELTKN